MFGAAYTWRVFFSEFYGMSAKRELNLSMKQKIFSTFPIMLPLKNPLRNLDGFCLPVCLFVFDSHIYTVRRYFP